MLLAPSSLLSATALAVAFFSFCVSARAEFTDTDHRALLQINSNVSTIREWNEDLRDVFYTNSRLMFGLFGTRGEVSYNDFSPQDNIYEFLKDLHSTIHDSPSGNELTILGALLGWDPYVIQPSVRTNGLIGIANSINDRAKGILQEGANITGALYAKDFSKSIYELVADGFQTMSNQNAEIVQHMVFTNLVNTVSAPVDLTMLTNIAIIVANSFSTPGSVDGILRILIPGYEWDDNFDNIRWAASLQPVWAAVIAQRWPLNSWGGGFVDRLKALRPSASSTVDNIVDLESWLMPYDIDMDAMDYSGLANRYYYEFFNTAETYSFITNELNQTRFSNTFANVFSYLPEMVSVSHSGEYNVSSTVVNNVGSGIEQVADSLAPRLYPDEPTEVNTNDIQNVEDASYKQFLQRLTGDSEIDTSFSEAVRSANSSIAGSIDNWKGSGPLVVEVPGISVLGATTDEISLDMTLSDATKQKINYYWDCLIKFLKVVMSLMFAIKSFMTIFGQASERDGMLFDI